MMNLSFMIVVFAVNSYAAVFCKNNEPWLRCINGALAVYFAIAIRGAVHNIWGL
jgi:hypothetical protein